MKPQNIKRKTLIKINQSMEGETIETKIELHPHKQELNSQH